MHILIPCKSLDFGKSRLAPCLDAHARQHLCRRLLVKTLELAVDVVSPEQIRLVTSDSDAAAIAARYGIGQIPDAASSLNAALRTARNALFASGNDVSSMMIIPIDLAFASSEAISAATACKGDVVIAPDEHETGTNLLLLRARAVRDLPFCYGPNSYAQHIASARARAFAIEALKDWRLAFDLDGPSQYAVWRAFTDVRERALNKPQS